MKKYEQYFEGSCDIVEKFDWANVIRLLIWILPIVKSESKRIKRGESSPFISVLSGSRGAFFSYPPLREVLSLSCSLFYHLRKISIALRQSFEFDPLFGNSFRIRHREREKRERERRAREELSNREYIFMVLSTSRIFLVEKRAFGYGNIIRKKNSFKAIIRYRDCCPRTKVYIHEQEVFHEIWEKEEGKSVFS